MIALCNPAKIGIEAQVFILCLTWSRSIRAERTTVSQGRTRPKVNPLSAVPEKLDGSYPQVCKDCHRYSEHRTFCLYV